MKIYITTCDQRINQTIEMYEYCIQKYWPQADVYVLGYKQPTYKSNKEIGRVGLSADNSNRPHIKISDIDNSNYSLFENTNTIGETYKLSAVWSAWNREYFLLYLNEFDNLWKWEVDGSIKSNSDNFKILGYTPAPIWFAHLIKQGSFKSTWYLEGVGHKFAADQVDQDKIKSLYDIK